MWEDGSAKCRARIFGMASIGDMLAKEMLRSQAWHHKKYNVEEGRRQPNNNMFDWRIVGCTKKFKHWKAGQYKLCCALHVQTAKKEWYVPSILPEANLRHMMLSAVRKRSHNPAPGRKPQAYVEKCYYYYFTATSTINATTTATTTTTTTTITNCDDHAKPGI